ncbi:MAG TPA: hypothetical protein VKB80_24820 [Kofleriaceae bacterium]|nr:hypothetical protein [Kofleriaceae bacterium]
MQKKASDSTRKKLALSKATVRVLTTSELKTVDGGRCRDGSIVSRGVVADDLMGGNPTGC